MKTRYLSLLTLCGAIAGSGLSALAVDTTSTQPAATIPASGAPRFSGRINDVVSLTESGVDQSIVLSYIKNSPGPFQPGADEIIKLRDVGVPTPVITALLQRGAELRDQAQTFATSSAAQSQAYAQSASSYSQPAPVTTVVTPPSTYVEPSSSVVYIGGSDGYPYYGSGYSYPYYYGYPYYYSRAGFYGPRLSFNFGSPFRFGFNGGHIGGGFHGGIGGGFHGGSGGFHGGGRR